MISLGFQPSLFRTIVSIVALLCFCNTAIGAVRAVEDVRGSKQDGVLSAEIALGCRMRYLDHYPRSAGTSVRIRLALSPECKRELGGIRSELYRPRGSYLGAIEEVEFETTGLGEATVLVRFQQPINFEVNQGALLNLLEILVDTEANYRADPQREPPVSRVAVEPPKAVESTRTREPLRLLPAKPRNEEYRFVINLVTLSPDDTVDLAGLQPFNDRVLYSNNVQIGDRQWKELRVGFFASESEAQTTLAQIAVDWPRAWISLADADERSRALKEPMTPIISNAAAASDVTETLPTLSDERSLALLADAKAALIDKNYGRSVQIYTRILENSDSVYRREAREFLGVAREKNGQLAHAKTEYQAYLAEFADDQGAARVRQRLAGLIDTVPAGRRLARAVDGNERAEWEFYGGVSQYYYRDVSKLQQDQADFVSQSAVMSQTNLVVQRRGERFDLLGRVNAGYYYDTLGESDGSGDQGLVSFAYLDINDHTLELNTRIGRQTSYTGGVLGRFDGLHLSYGWRPNITVNFTTGFPVDSPRNETETRRFFYGASVDFDNVAEAWDFSVFTNIQQVDGISDREAVGLEVQFHNQRWNLVGLTDFDLSYNVLNSALFIGNWRAHDRLTLNTRFDVGTSPYLTSRNALIGQSVTTIDALLETFNEGQVRRLARNRTAQTQTASIGFSAALSERFNLNSDISYSEIESTPASGGVAATPGTGGQLYYTANLVGSSLFKPRDTVITGIRYSTTDTSTTNTLIFDLRFPVGENLRINPRIAASTRNNALDDSDQWIFAPNLRLIYRWFQRTRLEFDLGGQWSNRDIPTDPFTEPGEVLTEKSSSYSFNVGYYADF